MQSYNLGEIDYCHETGNVYVTADINMDFAAVFSTQSMRLMKTVQIYFCSKMLLNLSLIPSNITKLIAESIAPTFIGSFEGSVEFINIDLTRHDDQINLIQSIRSLPSDLEDLTVDADIAIQSYADHFYKLTTLRLGKKFTRQLIQGDIPLSLKHMIIEGKYGHKIKANVIPSSLKTLAVDWHTASECDCFVNIHSRVKDAIHKKDCRYANCYYDPSLLNSCSFFDIFDRDSIPLTLDILYVKHPIAVVTQYTKYGYYNAFVNGQVDEDGKIIPEKTGRSDSYIDTDAGITKLAKYSLPKYIIVDADYYQKLDDVKVGGCLIKYEQVYDPIISIDDTSDNESIVSIDEKEDDDIVMANIEYIYQGSYDDGYYDYGDIIKIYRSIKYDSDLDDS